jgi:phosphoglycolate phosphatase-like HAD superfamily hydrolase
VDDGPAGSSPSPRTAVIDIDGVVADVSHRLHHLRSRPPRWEAFFTEAAADPPLSVGVDLVRGFSASGLVVTYLTGRPERIRAITEFWLRQYDLPTGRLLMRPDADRRPAARLKVDLLRSLARQLTIHVVVDDDERVIEALRGVGVPVLLADWAPRSRELGAAQERQGRT